MQSFLGRKVSTICKSRAGLRAESMYYQIEGTNVRLAGSMHLIPAGATVPQWTLDAYLWSDEVFIEANKDDMRTDGFLPPGQSSKTRVPPHLWKKIESCWPANHPLGVPGPQKLWLVAMVLALAGVSLSHGVENAVTERLKADARQIRYLETVGEFARLMDGVSDADYARAFALILDSSVDLRSQNLAKTYTAWISGQADAVAAVMRASPMAQFPAVRKAVFDARNAIWLPRIVELLGTRKRTVVYIGAGHLGGPAGLLALLGRAGHDVSPLLPG
jgi:uncharacterized protein